MKAAAAQRDITPKVGTVIAHPMRTSVGIHDPLFARALVLEDDDGTKAAIVCLDLIGASFETCDGLRREIEERLGIKHVLINFSHPHSSVGFAPWLLGDSVFDERWIADTREAIIDALRESLEALRPVELRAGRAPAQVGFNRRVMNDDGYVIMAPNREGPAVPWVNTLSAYPEGGSPQTPPIAVLFEHPAHPVIVPDESALISADFPGAAVETVRARYGDETVAMFAQGCCGNINGFPLRSSHEKAEEAGRKLGGAVIRAVETGVPVVAERLFASTATTMLPGGALPTIEDWQIGFNELHREYEAGNKWLTDQEYNHKADCMRTLRSMIERGDDPLERRFDVTTLSIGKEWGVVGLPHELFCEYELWVDESSPYQNTMVMGYTNGVHSYIATDKDLALGKNGGYEAGCLPDWGANGLCSGFFTPPGAGTERLIKECIASLWSEG